MALAVVFVGYTLTYFGFCSIRGPGVGLLDLVIPGRTVTIPSGGSGGVASGSIDPSTGIVTPAHGAPYRLVPVPGQPGQYSQEPVPPGLGGPVPSGSSVA